MELTSEQAADEIEAGGLDIRVERAPRQEVAVGGRCSVRSRDGAVFIGTVTGFSPYTLGVDVRLS